MKNNAKKWIALAITALVLVVSVFAKDKDKEVEQNIRDKYMKNFSDFSSYTEEVIQGTNPKEKIKVVDVDGVISSNDANDFVVEELKNAKEDPLVKGVILNVNSPGGSVYASERIANQIKALKEAEKPVYTVMGEMAASGGYYISALTDRIYASNETWTGSIGVIIQSYSLQGLFEKYGIKEQNITTGKMKDAGSQGRDMSKEEKEYFQGLVDSAFDRFVKIVAEGRGLSEREVRKLADGRVYDGSQALANGLVDKIGDLDSAIGDMASENNLEDPMVIRNENIMGSFSSIFSKVTDLKKSESDLAILDKLMKNGGPRPMYLYGDYND
ncbi:Protease 4 [Anaerococcus prevotii]|uniref:Signal peptide peptidase SppA, 36K type n=1 Tax=Anaerococcus prevotii (strain ATCC 9321 / DSM 20548 / JCM 6508 / NCTC 11806 / PC1) TaxID=525919 RepID=C7REV9_ANAPD|nr:signal peptide peptidase SppA [Anaerococcus prevotii]ACV29722.1 signal peptide peptidase SppA, 36K type [Anaerococcus prevotii DSM 20548]SUU95395.1 Protease 4 [Anaerococcus prevotii]